MKEEVTNCVVALTDYHREANKNVLNGVAYDSGFPCHKHPTKPMYLQLDHRALTYWARELVRLSSNCGSR